MQTIEDIVKSGFANEPYRRTALNIMYTAGWLQQMVSHVVKPYGLTQPQYHVLRIIQGNDGPLNLYIIQDRMLQKTSNVSRIIDKLEEKKLVERQKCSDNKRRVDIQITEEGKQLLDMIVPKVQQMFKIKLSHIGLDKVRHISDMLDEVRNEQ